MATVARKRDPAYPNVPTLEEQGFPGFDGTIRYLLVAPKDTPKPIVAKLNAAVNTVLASEAFAARFKTFGGIAVSAPHTPAYAAEVLAREDAKYTALIRAGKIKVE